MRYPSSDRRRVRAATISGATVLALAWTGLVPSVARAEDPQPNPFYFTAGELPTFETPIEVSRDPKIPQSIADLRSGEPSCAAPAPLAATDDSSDDGYTLPIRIKLTNGMLLAGFSPAAQHWKQTLPFQVTMGGLTGWVNARVQLPSMNLLVEPRDVHICDDGRARLGISDLGVAQYPEVAALDEEWGYADTASTQPDGSPFYPVPGTFSGKFSLSHPDAAPSNRYEVRDPVVNSVSAALVGMRSSGELELETKLSLGVTIARGDGFYEFPVDFSGTFSTAVKAPITPRIQDDVSWDIGDPVPERRSYLPTKPLPGAAEGSTTTVGSEKFVFDTSRLEALPTDNDARSLGVSLSTFLFGVDKYGQNILLDQPWAEGYGAYLSGMLDGSLPFFPMTPGVADLSIDMTVDRIGLPTGPPPGFGFDG